MERRVSIEVFAHIEPNRTGVFAFHPSTQAIVAACSFADPWSRQLSTRSAQPHRAL